MEIWSSPAFLRVCFVSRSRLAFYNRISVKFSKDDVRHYEAGLEGCRYVHWVKQRAPYILAELFDPLFDVKGSGGGLFSLLQEVIPILSIVCDLICIILDHGPNLMKGYTGIGLFDFILVGSACLDDCFFLLPQHVYSLLD